MIKKLTHLLLTGTVLIGLGYVLWIGFHKQHEKAEAVAEEAAAASEEAVPGAFTVMIDKERSNALAIDKEQPERTELQARRIAFGTVLDPSPLVALDGELATSEAALTASKAEFERSQALMATRDTSKKIAEAAEAQFNADRIKLETLTRNARLQWGAMIDADPSKRATFINELVTGMLSLIRVDLMPGDALAELPQSASVVVMGRDEQAFTTEEIMSATVTDTKSQAQGYLLRVKPPFTLRPGMALTAWLELPEKPRPGYAIPRSAVLRHDGRTWVYVQEEAEKYVRKPITLDAPLDGERGWFVTAEGGLTEEDVVVVVGAASLLSEELKAQGGGGEE